MSKYLRSKKNNKHISRFRVKNQNRLNTFEHDEPEGSFFHKIGFEQSILNGSKGKIHS